MIRKHKKAPEVGLFGDYIDGDDAMLVYDVDSDQSQDNLRPPCKKKSARRSQSA